MKHLILILTAMLTLPLVSMAEKSEYTLDNAAVESAFADAEEVSLNQINLFGGRIVDLFETTQTEGQMLSVSSVNHWAAFAITNFLDGFDVSDIHLASGRSMCCYPLACCGILGIIPLIDWVVPLVGAVQDDMRSYVGNSKFVMWK